MWNIRFISWYLFGIFISPSDNKGRSKRSKKKQRGTRAQLRIQRQTMRCGQLIRPIEFLHLQLSIDHIGGTSYLHLHSLHWFTVELTDYKTVCCGVN